MKKAFEVLVILVAVNGLLWLVVFSIPNLDNRPELYFLDVGQGDSQLLLLPGSNREPVKVLIDGGPNRAIIQALSRIIKSQDRYIDIVVATHPQEDHIGGLVDVMLGYDVGLLVTDGRRSNLPAYQRLIDLAEEKRVPIITLGAGDTIRHEKNELKVLAPTVALRRDPEINNASLVMFLTTEINDRKMSALFTGDAGFPVEEYLNKTFDLSTDVLKVGHHGSKYASGSDFLAELAPKIAVIGVGKNRYGHPTAEALSRLKQFGASVYTTLNDGTIKISVAEDQLQIYRTNK